MFIREFTVTELESSKVGAEAAEQAFHMDEQTFRVFYENTARPSGLTFPGSWVIRRLRTIWRRKATTAFCGPR